MLFVLKHYFSDVPLENQKWKLMGDNLINKENNITSTLSLVSEDTLYIRKKSDGLVVTSTNDNMVCKL